MAAAPTVDDAVLALARAAGLERVIGAFPADLAAAARAAAEARAAMAAADDALAEPWPPVRVDPAA